MASLRPVHRSWVEVSGGALLANVRALREHLGGAVGVMAVVKANAYGHGAPEVVRALRGSVEWFGVACVREAMEIAPQAGGTPILVLGPALPQERHSLLQEGFVPVISDWEEAQAYAALAGPRGVEVHLAIDSGMGRIGVWETEAVELLRACAGLRGLRVSGVASHLPAADEDDTYTLQQLTRFRSLVEELRAMRLFEGVVHVENSAGAIGFPSDAWDLVRAGLMLYGCAPRPEFQGRLRGGMTWKTRITLLRNVGKGRTISYGRTYVVEEPARIATLAVGYADGFQRHLSNRGAEVLVGGVRCPVLGRVTMDQIMVDVSAAGDVRTGDEVVLMGRQGGEEIGVAELAAKAGTIPWEIFTGIGRRVAREVVS
ncbi:MAG: alanine racemase [Verrucomicrobiota bacterium]